MTTSRQWIAGARATHAAGRARPGPRGHGGGDVGRRRAVGPCPAGARRRPGAAGRRQLRQRLQRRDPGDRCRAGRPRAPGRAGPGRAAAVKRAALLSFAVAGVAGLALVVLSGLWWLLLVGAAAIVAAWTYTGGPRPYGYAGLGEVFVFVFFGLVAVGGTAAVQVGSPARWPGCAAWGSARCRARSSWSTTCATSPGTRRGQSARWRFESATQRLAASTPHWSVSPWPSRRSVGAPGIVAPDSWPVAACSAWALPLAPRSAARGSGGSPRAGPRARPGLDRPAPAGLRGAAGRRDRDRRTGGLTEGTADSPIGWAIRPGGAPDPGAG